MMLVTSMHADITVQNRNFKATHSRDADGKNEKDNEQFFQLTNKALHSIPWSDSWHVLLLAVSYGVLKETHKKVKSDKTLIFPLSLH